MAPNRDAQGRFIKGHTAPGPGRPPLSAELPVSEGIKAATSAEKVAQILDVMHAQALLGDVKAATIYLAYALGRPRQQIDLTNNGGEFAAPQIFLPAVQDEDETGD
jgi:hypothetical protein